MRAELLHKPMAAARWLLLLLLAGHLLLRQDFAHASLGKIANYLFGWNLSRLQQAYPTEIVLALLFPLAAFLVWRACRSKPLAAAGAAVDGVSSMSRQAPLWLAFALGVWAAGWGVTGLLEGRSVYLVLRQTMLAGYAVFFVYVLLFFLNVQQVRRAVLWAIAVALFCAFFDANANIGLALFAERAPVWLKYWAVEKPYGQETLALAILGLSLLIVSPGKWRWRVLAFAGLALAGWRQNARFQSSVAVSLAGAVGLYLALGVMLAVRGQRQTLKRGALLLAFFGVLLGCFLAYSRMYKHARNEVEEAQEVHAWSLGIYSGLFKKYEDAKVPGDAREFVFSTRTAQPVTDLEVYRLNAVWNATANLSVRNNMWRFLVWRRMLLDWWTGDFWLGAGPGKKWFYGGAAPRESALYHTCFHYGEDDLGLDPHNSYINFLHRFGLLGFALFALLAGSVLFCAFRALWNSPQAGNVWLEGLLLYFFYTAVFAFFNVGLEGPSYSLPFWMSLGLAYAEARNSLRSV